VLTDEEQANPADKKAAALNEEAAETKAQPKLKKTAMKQPPPRTRSANPNGNAATGTDIKSKVKATSMPIENKPSCLRRLWLRRKPRRMKATMAVPVALSLISNRKPLDLSGFTGRFRDDLDMPNSPTSLREFGIFHAILRP